MALTWQERIDAITTARSTIISAGADIKTAITGTDIRDKANVFLLDMFTDLIGRNKRGVGLLDIVDEFTRLKDAEDDLNKDRLDKIVGGAVNNGKWLNVGDVNIFAGKLITSFTANPMISQADVDYIYSEIKRLDPRVT